MTEPAIITEGLTRAFDGVRAVDELSIEIPPGAVLALLGENGAGKTTTIRLLNGVLRPHGGSARVLGLDPATDGDVLRRRTGVVTENAGLDDRLTAEENLLVTSRLHGIADDVGRQRIRGLLAQFGMDRHADHLCRGFSTGQRRRVALARALLSNPELLFLDEPTSGLDPAGSQAVLALISQLSAEEGRTVVLCTHFLSEAADLADWMSVMERGRLLIHGRPGELASEMFSGLDAELELDGPPERELVEMLGHQPWVHEALAAPSGLRVNVTDRDALASVVRLVSARRAVYSVTPHIRGLQDVYFAVQTSPLPEVATS